MDNLSHSVVGLAVGELVHRSLSQEIDTSRQCKRRRLLLFSCWSASNFPDLDYFLTPLLPAPLGYLLHHRGHTHTLIYAIPQAVLLAAMIWLFWPAARKVLKESGTARRGVAITLTLGFALHLLMDYLNSYGIHPFHPFDSRWLYGDMVFILEPMFWILFGVPLVMM
jgi:inner membrane protein